MKHYKLFESKISDINLSDVEEVFYNISDRQNKIEDIKVHVNRVIITIDSGKIYNMFYDKPEYPSGTSNGILVLINFHKSVDLNSIKDDLEFAINYISKEMKLNMVELSVGFGYSGSKVFKNFNDLSNRIDQNGNVIIDGKPVYARKIEIVFE